MAKPKSNSRCDRKAVEEFDYSGLSPEFSKLARPAQRALINHGVLTPRDLSRVSKDEVLKLHGIGPSALPILRAVLKKHGLSFFVRSSGRLADQA